MLQCMNTGHDGSMSTGHANSATDMLARLENMVLMGMDLPLTAIRNQIASGVDVIVHLGRIRDKSRRVLEITEVVGCENGEIRLNPLYQFEELGKTVKEKWSAGCGEKENYFMKESLRQQDYHKVFQKREIAYGCWHRHQG